MADQSAAPPRRRNPVSEPAIVRWLLIGICALFLALFLVLPLGTVLGRVFAAGWDSFAETLSDSDTKSAIWLTLSVAALAVPFNLVFGIATAWAIAKFEFKGKTFLTTLIDLPFSVSSVISGLVYVLLFGAVLVRGCADARRAVDEPLDRSTFPITAPPDQIFGERAHVEPSPPGGAPAAGLPSPVVEIEGVDVNPYAHPGILGGAAALGAVGVLADPAGEIRAGESHPAAADPHMR